jgi:hypothetical protein
MARKRDNLPLVWVGGALGVSILLHTLWSILFEDWIKHQLEHFVGHSVAEMLERFGDVGFVIVGLIAIGWFVHAYTKASLKDGATPKPEAAPRHEDHPTIIDPKWSRDLLLSEALWRVCNGNWNGRLELVGDDDKKTAKLWNSATAIRQLAFNGALPIWARRPRSNLYEPVPREFWRNHDIEVGYRSLQLRRTFGFT